MRFVIRSSAYSGDGLGNHSAWPTDLAYPWHPVEGPKIDHFFEAWVHLIAGYRARPPDPRTFVTKKQDHCHFQVQDKRRKLEAGEYILNKFNNNLTII